MKLSNLIMFTHQQRAASGEKQPIWHGKEMKWPNEMMTHGGDMHKMTCGGDMYKMTCGGHM